MHKRRKQKKPNSGQNLALKLGQALKTVLKNGGSVEITVKSNEEPDPFGESYPEIPDWLKS